MRILENIKKKLDCDDMTFFICTNRAKSEKQFQKYLNSYLLRFFVLLRYNSKIFA